MDGRRKETVGRREGREGEPGSARIHIHGERREKRQGVRAKRDTQLQMQMGHADNAPASNRQEYRQTRGTEQ